MESKSTTTAKYWKNGVETILTDPSLAQLHVTGIVVENGNVHVSGWGDYGSYTVAKYWKNGVRTNLGAAVYSSKAYSLVVSGNDVYVAGEEGNGAHTVAMYWKNDTPNAITDGTIDASAESIFVHGNDVYTCGGTRTANWYATYWKNQTQVVLNPTGQSYASGIFVK